VLIREEIQYECYKKTTKKDEQEKRRRPGEASGDGGTTTRYKSLITYLAYY